MHISNVFKEKELQKDPVVKEFLTTAAGKRYRVAHFNPDLIISVGYRVHSNRGVQFRIWATGVLRDHLMKNQLPILVTKFPLGRVCPCGRLLVRMEPGWAKSGWGPAMTEDDLRIFHLLAARIRERFPEARIWVFGSRARGDATWDSDFDTCVVLDHLDAAADEALSDIAWEVGFGHGRVISVLPFSRDEFERGPFSESGLVEAIRREGIAA